MQQKIFITGGAGFVGSHTVDRLLKEGNSVTVFDIKPWKDAINIHHQEGKLTYIEGNICDYDLVKKSIGGHNSVLHLAAVVSVPLSVQDPINSHETNVTGTLHVLEAARKANISRVVYASSAAVYGDQRSLPVTEDVSLVPQSPYGLHKAINDEYAALYERQFGLRTMGLRYFNIFGKRQDPSSPYSGVISIFADRIKRGEQLTIYGDGNATRDFVHVDNIVDANIKSLSSDAVGVCNIASGIETTLNELVSTLGEITGSEPRVEYQPKRPGDVEKSYASIAEASRCIGYTPSVSLKEGLVDLLS